MSVFIRIKRDHVYLDVVQGSKHHWEALHIKLSDEPSQRKEQLRIAEMCRAKRELQLVTGEWNFTDAVAGKQTLIAYMSKMGRNKSPKDPFVRAVKYLEEFPRGDIKLCAINEKWVHEWQEFLLNHPNLSQMTAHHYGVSVRVALNQAVKERILPSSPADAVKGIPKPDTDKPTLTVDEFRAICNLEIAPNLLLAEVRRGFVFACLTGLRVSDISSLRWGEIESRPVSKTNSCAFWIRKIQVKTKQPVEIPLTPDAMALIEPFGIPDAFVFKRLCKNGQHTDQYVKELASLAGIRKKISWHTARRSCATFMLEAGVDPFTVQKILGHRKIEMTAIYAKTDRKKAGAVSALTSMLSAEADEILNSAG